MGIQNTWMIWRLVFLMGLHQLERFTKRLISVGMVPETPAAVVFGGNVPYPKTVRGSLVNIAERTEIAEAEAPTVIVVGPVAVDLSATVEKLLKNICVEIEGSPIIMEKLDRNLQMQGVRVWIAEICYERTFDHFPLAIAL